MTKIICTVLETFLKKRRHVSMDDIELPAFIYFFASVAEHVAVHSDPRLDASTLPFTWWNYIYTT